MDFAIQTLTDEEVAAEMSRTKGRKSEWPEVLAAILKSDGCDIAKAFGIRLDFPGKNNATVVAGLRKAAKVAKHESLTIRVTPDSETSVNIVNSVKVAAK